MDGGRTTDTEPDRYRLFAVYYCDQVFDRRRTTTHVGRKGLLNHNDAWSGYYIINDHWNKLLFISYNATNGCSNKYAMEETDYLSCVAIY